MELGGVQLPLRAFHGRHRAYRRVGGDLKACRGLEDAVCVAHPADGGWLHIFEKDRGLIHLHLRLSIFTDRGARHLPAQGIGHQLGTIADPQDRDPHGEDLCRDVGRTFVINTVGTAGEDDPLGSHLPDLLQSHSIRMYLTVNITLPDPAGDQLVILPAKIQDDDHLSVHSKFPFCACISGPCGHETGLMRSSVRPNMVGDPSLPCT